MHRTLVGLESCPLLDCLSNFNALFLVQAQVGLPSSLRLFKNMAKLCTFYFAREQIQSLRIVKGAQQSILQVFRNRFGLFLEVGFF